MTVLTSPATTPHKRATSTEGLACGPESKHKLHISGQDLHPDTGVVTGEQVVHEIGVSLPGHLPGQLNTGSPRTIVLSSGQLYLSSCQEIAPIVTASIELDCSQNFHFHFQS